VSRSAPIHLTLLPPCPDWLREICQLSFILLDPAVRVASKANVDGSVPCVNDMSVANAKDELSQILEEQHLVYNGAREY
jgi:hypothetical protein